MRKLRGYIREEEDAGPCLVLLATFLVSSTLTWDNVFFVISFCKQYYYFC